MYTSRPLQYITQALEGRTWAGRASEGESARRRAVGSSPAPGQERVLPVPEDAQHAAPCDPIFSRSRVCPQTDAGLHTKSHVPAPSPRTMPAHRVSRLDQPRPSPFSYPTHRPFPARFQPRPSPVSSPTHRPFQARFPRVRAASFSKSIGWRTARSDTGRPAAGATYARFAMGAGKRSVQKQDFFVQGVVGETTSGFWF